MKWNCIDKVWFAEGLYKIYIIELYGKYRIHIDICSDDKESYPFIGMVKVRKDFDSLEAAISWVENTKFGRDK